MDHYSFRAPVICFVAFVRDPWQFPLPFLTDEQKHGLHQRRALFIALPRGYIQDGEAPIEIVKSNEPVALTASKSNQSATSIYSLVVDSGIVHKPDPPPQPTLMLALPNFNLGVTPPTPQPNRASFISTRSTESNVSESTLSTLLSRARDAIGTASGGSSPIGGNSPTSPLSPSVSTVSSDTSASAPVPAPNRASTWLGSWGWGGNKG